MRALSCSCADDFKPASVDLTKVATLDVSTSNQVTVTVPNYGKYLVRSDQTRNQYSIRFAYNANRHRHPRPAEDRLQGQPAQLHQGVRAHHRQGDRPDHTGAPAPQHPGEKDALREQQAVDQRRQQRRQRQWRQQRQ